MPYPHPPRNDGRVTLWGVDVLSALMPDSAEMLGRHLLLIGSAVTLTCTALHIDRALAHSGSVPQTESQAGSGAARLTGRTATRDCAVLLVRGALGIAALSSIPVRSQPHTPVWGY